MNEQNLVIVERYCVDTFGISTKMEVFEKHYMIVLVYIMV